MTLAPTGKFFPVFGKYCSLRGWAISFAIIQTAYDGCHVALVVILLTRGLAGESGGRHGHIGPWFMIMVVLPIILVKFLIFNLAYSIFSTITKDESRKSIFSSFKKFVCFKCLLVPTMLLLVGLLAGFSKLLEPVVLGYVAIDVGIFAICAIIVGFYIKSGRMNPRAAGLYEVDENCNVEIEAKVDPVDV